MKYRISFVGSGNVATHFALAFRDAGHTIVEVCSQTFAHAQELALRVGANAVTAIEMLSADIDVCFLAVPDDAVASIASAIRLPGAVVVHTSGSLPLAAVPVSLRGVVWSPQSFVRGVAMDYSDVPFCFDADDAGACDLLASLLASVSVRCCRLDDEQRRWTHLAAVIVNNFGNFLNATAQRLLADHGIPFSLLAPIIATTASRAVSATPYISLGTLQTGPAVRNDVQTLDRHRALLADDEGLRRLYDLISSLIARDAALRQSRQSDTTAQS